MPLRVDRDQLEKVKSALREVRLKDGDGLKLVAFSDDHQLEKAALIALTLLSPGCWHCVMPSDVTELFREKING